MSHHFRLLLDSTVATTSLLTLLRRHTGTPLSQLRGAIAEQRPVLDESPHHNQYSDFLTGFSAMLDKLECEGIGFRVEVDGVPESTQYVRNIQQQWLEGLNQIQYIAELESDQACVETLQWLKRESPAEVYLATLRQIANDDGWDCDEETLSWVQRELRITGTDTDSTQH